MSACFNIIVKSFELIFLGHEIINELPATLALVLGWFDVKTKIWEDLVLELPIF